MRGLAAWIVKKSKRDLLIDDCTLSFFCFLRNLPQMCSQISRALLSLSLSLHQLFHRSDYGGWPEHQSEIPMAFMTKQHRETIRQYCTRNPENAAMPDLPTYRNGEEEKSMMMKLVRLH